MDKILKPSQLARALGVNNAFVSMAIKRGFLQTVPNEKNINIELPVNKLWIESQIKNNGRTFDINRIFDKGEIKQPIRREDSEPDQTIKTQQTPIPNHGGASGDLIEKKIRTEIEYKEGQIKLNKIREDKMNAQLIPREEAKNLIAFLIGNIQGEFIQKIDALLEIFKMRLDMEHDEYVEIKKELHANIHGLVDDSVKEMQASIEALADKYTEVRARGESK